ncbi:MAG: HDOD domain-containing protein [Kofleriaceae bacterium]|nr:HDOD domain-containing protein [Kofleriaceae bacterium]
MTPRILFVDDEPAILMGLQNLLHKDRKRWTMTFLPSGDAAEAMLDTEHFEVVVTDMRMPGLDGGGLLTLLQRDHPATARIMLSGHADSDAIMRSLHVVHQLLSKPCAATVLRDAIERGTVLARLGPLAAAVGGLDTLPTPPEILEALSSVLAAPTTATLVDVVERDPALSAKALQLVNFHYFGSGAVVCSIADAVAQLGPDRIRHIASCATKLADPTALVEHQAAAYLRARAERRATVREGRDLAFTTALLRDLGRLVLLATGADAGGISHAEIGATLLELWGLPRAIVDRVRAG